MACPVQDLHLFGLGLADRSASSHYYRARLRPLVGRALARSPKARLLLVQAKGSFEPGQFGVSFGIQTL
jgi:hypothetical protein